MKVKDLLDLYDNWNGKVTISTVVEDKWKLIIKGAEISRFVDEFKHMIIMDREILAFGYYDGELTIRV